MEAFPLVPCTSAMDFLVKDSQSKVDFLSAGNKFAGANNGSDCSANTGLPVLV